MSSTPEVPRIVKAWMHHLELQPLIADVKRAGDALVRAAEFCGICDTGGAREHLREKQQNNDAAVAALKAATKGDTGAPLPDDKGGE